MNKILLSILLCIASFANAQQLPPDLRDYIATQKPLRDSGQIKESEYFAGLYSQLLKANAPSDFLDRTNRMVRNAEIYEAGTIDKSEYEYRRRAIQAEEASAQQARRSAAETQARIDQQADQARQQQRSNAILATAAQLLQSSGPRPIYQNSPQVPSSMGMMGFLKTQSVNGTLRYCRYSNGVVNTINSFDLCPLDTH